MATPPPTRLVASGLGEREPGGLFVLDGSRFVPIDRISTCGLALDRAGTRLARLLWTDDDPQGSGELMVYDAGGVRSYHRLDAVREPHGARWDGDQLAVVSTLDDSIIWLDDAGREQRRWTGFGDGDCWHVNCVGAAPDGSLVASAFGRFESHRGWTGPGRREGQGLVFDPVTGDELLSGLHAPHDPTAFDGGWLVCNSGERELLELGAAGTPGRRVDLGGWTRGLAVDDDHVYVGVSAHRLSGVGGDCARVVVLDRESLEHVESLPLPCAEVFSLVLVSDELVGGLNVGFGGNRRRHQEHQLLELEAAATATETLTAEQAQLYVSAADVPARATPGVWLSLAFTATNEGAATLASIEPGPVLIGARWTDQQETVLPAEARAGLRRPLLAGHTGRGVVRICAPTEPGTYRLTIGGVQEPTGWFEQFDPARSVSFEVVVED